VSESLWTRGLAEFRDAVASTEPTPGGGSVAMVSAALGAGLVVMALEITARKPESDAAAAELAGLLAEGRRLLAELSRHADEDVAVFRAYMSAFRLPRGTDAEKAARKQALQQATVDATRVPLAGARSCLEGLELAGRAAPASAIQVVSDVGAGAALLGGAVTAVLLNVDINLPGLGDSVMKQELGADRAKLADRARELSAAVLSRVAARLS
jgi:methenyltetrahydrofolate cyclohydrolase